MGDVYDAQFDAEARRTTTGRHSMDSPEWYTPTRIVDAARATMGSIDLDPASHAEANKIVQATQFFTAEDDGLKQDWHHCNVFLNPPGGLVNEFWKKLIYSGVKQAIWIGYSLEQLQTLQQTTAPTLPFDFPMCIPAKRIAFIENAAKKAERLAKVDAENIKRAHLGHKLRARNEKGASPSHANYITYIGPNVHDFIIQFDHIGRVIIPKR